MRKALLLFILICGISCNAQVTVNTSQLTETKWTIDGGGKIGEDTLTFYKDYELDVAYFPLLKRTSKFTKPYYLSDSIPKTFDHSKVGTSTSGCYIIVYNNNLKRMTVYEIRTFDLKNRKMVLYNPYIRDAFRDGTITYRYLGSHGGGRR